MRLSLTNLVEVIVDEAEVDGVLVLFIDTKDDTREDENGPIMRIYLNDSEIYENPVFPGPEEEVG